MKRLAKLLLEKATNSLLLSVDHSNKISDIGRSEAVIILLDHSFEMLLKAALTERGANIRVKNGKRETIGIKDCINIATTRDDVSFLNQEQAQSIQLINNLRNSAQHFLTDIREQLLYSVVQTGLNCFRDVLRNVFDIQLADYFPERVLLLSTTPPADIFTIYQTEVAKIQEMLRPGRRAREQALARLRPLAILEETLQGQDEVLNISRFKALEIKLREENSWEDIFPAVTQFTFTTDGSGYMYGLRLTKGEGAPVQFVPEGTPGADKLAIREVNMLDRYGMNITRLRKKLGLSQYVCLAIIWKLRIREDKECHKIFNVSTQPTKRYSHKALERIRDDLPNLDIDKVKQEYTNSQRNKGKQHKRKEYS